MPRKQSTKKAARRPARTPEPEAAVLEEVDSGAAAGIDEGIVITTFALLLGAVYLLYTLLGERYPGA